MRTGRTWTGWLAAVLLTLTAPLHAAPAKKPAPVPATAATPAPLDFRSDILPILTRAGCNSGACHGAAIGQGGFRLSLLGYDPEADYQRITREYGARRVHLGDPGSSLLLLKGGAQVAHGGGRRLSVAGPHYERLRQWIAAGAAWGDRPRGVTTFRVEPARAMVARVGEEVRLQVRATFSDGSHADVTGLTLFSSNDDGIAEVTPEGRVTVRRRGVATVAVRFQGEMTAVRVGARFGDAPVDVKHLMAGSALDRAVGRTLAEVGLPPSPQCDDATFLRRLYLDVLGVLPTPEEVRHFLEQEPAAAKRPLAIQAAVRRPEFTDYWTHQLADLLLINSKRLGEAPARAYHAWLRDQVARGEPLDRMFGALVEAEGDIARVAPANFLRVASDPRDQMEFFARTVLGVRLECARCHNHPFDRWTQDDYYGMAAYFARVRVESGRLFEAERGEVQHPRTGRDVTPRLLPDPNVRTAALGGGEGVLSRKAAVASWLGGRGRPLMARALVNRVVRRLLGRGLVEPVDDLRATNPASNPELLDVLAQRLEERRWNLREFVSEIAASQVYQLASTSNGVNRQDDRFYSRGLLRPLTGPVLADAIAQATGVPHGYPGQPEGTRAVQLLDASVASYTLDVFGRCRRERPGDSLTTAGGGLSQALHLINSEGLDAQIRTGVARLMARVGTPEAQVEELYLRTLSRPPSAAERAHWEKQLTAVPERREVLEDLLWALLNSREFSFIH